MGGWGTCLHIPRIFWLTYPWVFCLEVGVGGVNGSPHGGTNEPPSPPQQGLATRQKALASSTLIQGRIAFKIVHCNQNCTARRWDCSCLTMTNSKLHCALWTVSGCTVGTVEERFESQHKQVANVSNNTNELRTNMCTSCLTKQPAPKPLLEYFDYNTGSRNTNRGL